jgi:hypothetical protein
MGVSSLDVTSMSVISNLALESGTESARAHGGGVLKGSAVKHFDLLGCEIASLAAELSIGLPQMEVGYLRSWRQDNFEVDPNTTGDEDEERPPAIGSIDPGGRHLPHFDHTHPENLGGSPERSLLLSTPWRVSR